MIDESLCQSPFHKGQLLGSKPSEDGELWVPYLEKAFAIHCGGWDHIIGGQVRTKNMCNWFVLFCFVVELQTCI